jgi:cleavage stimulation factor subunit 3
MRQVELWNAWINWEKDDPLTLLPDESDVYRKRILHLYRQAVMSLRFWPEMWAEASDWCYANNFEEDAGKFLDEGIAANPESALLAFKKADRIESTLSTDDSDLAAKGASVRAPFDKLLDTLYDMIKQLKTREARDLVKLEESLAVDASISAILSKAEDDDEENDQDKVAREADKAAKIQNIQAGYASQAELLSRTISFAWIALMRAMRRVQGKGSPKDSVGGSRKVFADARARGKLTSDVYVAAALIEHNVYKDPAGTKIFERGAKLFPEDATFTLEYLKHLLSVGDLTNARVTFETVVGRLTNKAQALVGAQKTLLMEKAKPLFAQFHKYESQYGELSQISKLEQRMSELFPEDPKLSRFASRFSSEGFDPLAVRVIISPAVQMRPITTMKVMQSIEKAPSVHNSPRPQYIREASPRPQPPPQYLQAATNSPKRPFQGDDGDSELNRPRKLARGESPLKGAAGRRLDQQKRLQPGYAASSFTVPRDITFLLSIIPRAEDYKHTRFNPESLVRLLRETIVPDYSTWKDARDQSQPPPMQQQQPRYDSMPTNNYNMQRGVPPVATGMAGGYPSYVSGPGYYGR